MLKNQARRGGNQLAEADERKGVKVGRTVTLPESDREHFLKATLDIAPEVGVRFDARDLWGHEADQLLKVSVDAWEPYLEPADQAVRYDLDARARQLLTVPIHGTDCKVGKSLQPRSRGFPRSGVGPPLTAG